jgi:hypothetical protein
VNIFLQAGSPPAPRESSFTCHGTAAAVPSDGLTVFAQRACCDSADAPLQIRSLCHLIGEIVQWHWLSKISSHLLA